MSRSFRPRPDPGEDQPFDTPGENVNISPADSENELSNTGSSRTPYKYGAGKKTSNPGSQVDIRMRLVAGLIDVMAGYIIGLAFSCIPLVNTYIHDLLILVSFLLVRDALFQGRGIGKNLMGLQVIDKATGKPASLMQSIKRNIVVFGPYLALYIVSTILRIVPNDTINSVVTNIANGVFTIYTMLVIPYEIYRVYTREDAQRWGDQFAGTAIVQADMDFSNPFSK